MGAWRLSVGSHKRAVTRWRASASKFPKPTNGLSPILNYDSTCSLLSYYIADLRGCDIDKPRNLAKSVTVE